ncbi:MAG: hypothetical protein Q9207_002495, partial [Kuettlingeria erythrocarpa]
MEPLKESSVHLLIIGAGPAGLMAAAWATRYGISYRIIDKREARVQTGHADGLQPRTLEILDSFGIVDRPMKEGFHVMEICSWNPGAAGQIQRTQRVKASRDGISRLSQIGLNQGAVEAVFEDFLEKNANCKVERNTDPQHLAIDHQALGDPAAYPIMLTVHRSHVAHDDRSQAGSFEKIRAKYLIGCDGAHSWTRKQLAISLEGEATEHRWGVMDIVPLTDFPDIRLSCAIHSASQGTVMTFPRENHLVRFYIQLPNERQHGQADHKKPSLESIFKTAQRILAPYTLEYSICDWWSVYCIGQRLAPRFDVDHRIFLAGDAVHTHSPKAGQGMNVSMQDTYNLTWKLCLIVLGLAHPRILSTYHSERHAVAKDLIAMDQQLAKFYSAVDDPRRMDYQTFRDSYAGFIAGVGVRYGGSCLVDTACNKRFSIPGMRRQQQQRIEVGMRIPAIELVNHASAEPTHLHALLPSTGAFRVIVFAGRLGSSSDRLKLVNSFAPRLQALVDRYNDKHTPRPPPSPCLLNGVEYITADDTTLLGRRTTPGWNESKHTPNKDKEEDKASLVLLEILLLHSGTCDALALLDLHAVFHPWDAERGWDYGRVFVVGGDIGDHSKKDSRVDDDDNHDNNDNDSPVEKGPEAKDTRQEGW